MVAEVKKEDALEIIFLRNEFYKKKFYLALAAWLISLMVIVTLSGVVYILIKNPRHPLYFVADEYGRLIEDIPVTRPNMSNDEVERWVVNAVEKMFSLDFMNYRQQMQDVQKYFTEYGWRQYIKGFNATNNLFAITQRSMVVIAKVVGKPKLETEGMLSGAYAWRYEMPVLVTYLTPPFDDKSRFSNPLKVTVIVQRKSILTSYRGLGLVQVIANFSLTPPSQPIKSTIQ